MIKILIADDHTMFRQGLKRIISPIADMVVEEARNCKDTIQKVSNNGFNVVVLDIAMPDGNGIEIIKELKKIRPGIQVLILSMYSEDQYAFRAIKSGASGYLTKNAEASELIVAIRKVLVNEKYITPEVAKQLAIGLANNIRIPSHSSLSNREYQIMCMISSGKTITNIAKELALSINTISTFRSRILKKMNLRNNAEITHYAIKEKLID